MESVSRQIEHSPWVHINKGDCICINDVHEIAGDLKEFLGFMRFSLEAGFDVVFADGSIDTKTAMGTLFREICKGLDEFDDNAFGHREQEDYPIRQIK